MRCEVGREAALRKFGCLGRVGRMKGNQGEGTWAANLPLPSFPASLVGLGPLIPNRLTRPNPAPYRIKSARLGFVDPVFLPFRLIGWVSSNLTACSLVGFSQGLSVSQPCFPLTTNQHQRGLSAHKPTSEQAVSPLDGLKNVIVVGIVQLNSCVQTLTLV